MRKDTDEACACPYTRNQSSRPSEHENKQVNKYVKQRRNESAEHNQHKEKVPRAGNKNRSALVRY